MRTMRTEKTILKRLAASVLAALIVFAALPFAAIESTEFTADAAAITATGKTTDLVNVRKSASISSASLGTLRKNTKVKITKEVFTSSTSASSTTRWYAVSGGGKKGYIRADLIKDIKYSNTKATTTAALNYRSGAGTSMNRLGTLNYGKVVTVCLPAKAKGSSDTWYKIYTGSRYAYVSGSFLDFSNKLAKQLSAKGKTALTKKLLSNPTNGGKARIVGTFTSKNCKKKFTVTGHAGNRVPQGMAFTGKQYHIIFGMNGGQSVVTYSAKGERLAARKFGYNMGHPNSMTWDPITKKCYIFRGYEHRCHYWDPATNKFGRIGMPYSSSGVGYDKITKKLYVTSKTGVRVYSADGKFRHENVFNRCHHSGTTYVQDCGAQNGYIFHAVSGANKHATNYLDVYRAIDEAYLGTIKVNLGETESVVVGSDGSIELLINHAGTYEEAIWKTPLNINDFK